MPEPDSNRKRSRSPSDSDTQKQHKRPNTGAPVSSAASDDSKPNISSSSNDVANATGDKSGTASSDAGGETSGTGSSNTNVAGQSMSNIHMRCLIVTQDASIIIGKAGAHVNEIREKSGARVTVSESIPGNPERILNVNGPLDAVSKAFGLIVRRINDEPFDKPSVPGSRAVTIKFMIPNSRMGSVIGKAGAKIKEIQDASGARLNASEGMLPMSTERVLSVSGVADAIHIATYYIGNILIEAQERAPHNTSRDTTYRPTSYSRRPGTYNGPGGAPGGAPPYGMPGPGPSPGPGHGYPPPLPHHAPHPHHPPHPHGPHGQMQVPYGTVPPPPSGVPLQTQQIFIPNDLVGCIIGKGGSKINEIRQMSASTIKIMEPGAQGAPGMPGMPPGSEGERLVVITGAPANIQMAVSMLYTRLEQEKQKQLRQASM